MEEDHRSYRRNFFYFYQACTGFAPTLLTFAILVQRSTTGLKRRVSAVLSWLDFSTTWFQMSNLTQSNKIAVAENKTKK